METEQHAILELLHARRKKSSTIFCPQCHDSGWCDQLAATTARWPRQSLTALRTAYRINIVPTTLENHRSMREVYGLDPAKAE